MLSRMKQRRLWPAVAAASLAVLGLAAIFLLGSPSARSLQLQAGTPLPEPRPLPDFTLQGDDGRPFTRASLEGQWTLVFSGFTSCPDICPATLAVLAAIDERLRRADREVQVLFVALDPERDDPATVRAYLNHFNKGFWGVSGDKAQIDALMAALGLGYLRVPTGADTYTIDHSTALVLVDPQARVAGYFKAPLRAEGIAADLEPVLAQH